MNKTIGIVSILFAVSVADADRVRVVPRASVGEARTETERVERPASPKRAEEPVRSIPRQQYQRQRTVQVESVRHPSFRRELRRRDRVRVVPGKTHWRSYQGNRYAHRYHNGRHWYGFYHGPRFHWTHYHHNRWWWYDPAFSHWNFWWNGYWWWGVPGGVYHVYVNNAYQPYDAAQIDVAPPDQRVPEPDATPPATTTDKSARSPDNKRMIQITGEDAEAYLYDTSGTQPVFVKTLGKGVRNARFTESDSRNDRKILIDFDDGRFAMHSYAGSCSNRGKQSPKPYFLL